jgi:hypothetical protein
MNIQIDLTPEQILGLLLLCSGFFIWGYLAGHLAGKK